MASVSQEMPIDVNDVFSVIQHLLPDATSGKTTAFAHPWSVC
jgi:hypothetical protein